MHTSIGQYCLDAYSSTITDIIIAIPKDRQLNMNKLDIL